MYVYIYIYIYRPCEVCSGAGAAEQGVAKYI